MFYKVAQFETKFGPLLYDNLNDNLSLISLSNSPIWSHAMHTYPLSIGHFTLGHVQLHCEAISLTLVTFPRGQVFCKRRMTVIFTFWQHHKICNGIASLKPLIKTRSYNALINIFDFDRLHSYGNVKPSRAS